MLLFLFLQFLRNLEKILDKNSIKKLDKHQPNIIKKRKKRLKKVSWKVSKSFWIKKGRKYGYERYNNLSEDEKQLRKSNWMTLQINEELTNYIESKSVEKIKLSVLLHIKKMLDF